MALPAIPTRHQDSAAHRQRIAESVNGITSFQFDDSRVRTQAEITAGVTPFNYAYPFGHAYRYGIVDDDATDNGTAIRAVAQMMATAGGGSLYFPFSNTGIYRYTGTLYFYGDDVRFVGDSQGVVLKKTDTGTMIAGHPNSHVNPSYTYVQRGGFRHIYLTSTTATIGLDITGFSYSRFNDFEIYLPGNSRKLIYGVGENGSSPYYNSFDDFALFGNNDGATSSGSVGVAFEPGAWTGGSNGPNGNFFTNLRRAAALDWLFDIQAGNGNLGSCISGESIHEAYFRLNSRAVDASGTSTGSNAENTLNHTGAGWTVNAFVNASVKITGGTGNGQIRRIGSNTATQLSLVIFWTFIPDNTSTYEIYLSKAVANKFSLIRGEGLNTSNPDFINSLPGARGHKFSQYTVESLGSGLVVNDTAKDPSNSYWDGDLVAIPFLSTGIAAATTISLTPSVGGAFYQGGYGFDGDFVVESMHISCEGESTGTAVVTLTVDSTYTLTGTINNSQRWAVFVAGDNRIISGSGKKIHVSVTTDAGWTPATADFAVTVMVRLLR